MCTRPKAEKRTTRSVRGTRKRCGMYVPCETRIAVKVVATTLWRRLFNTSIGSHDHFNAQSTSSWLCHHSHFFAYSHMSVRVRDIELLYQTWGARNAHFEPRVRIHLNFQKSPEFRRFTPVLHADPAPSRSERSHGCPNNLYEVRARHCPDAHREEALPKSCGPHQPTRASSRKRTNRLKNESWIQSAFPCFSSAPILTPRKNTMAMIKCNARRPN